MFRKETFIPNHSDEVEEIEQGNHSQVLGG